jgi:uncharacterized protein DUF5947
VGGPAGGPGAELVGGGAGAGRQTMEKCELCSAEIPAEHGHVADLGHSSLLCACRACYLLFTHSQAGRGRYRAVPDRYLGDPDRPMTAAEWEELEIPVGLAFFLLSSDAGEVTGFYPSPAGATECRLDLAAWDRLAAGHPLLGAMAPDVEAILICRTGEGVEHFLVPIDACYELAGRMRLHWRGFDGGAEARQSIADFLGQVRSQARPLGGVAGSGLAERGVAGSGLAERGVAGSGLAERGVAGSGLAERGAAGSGLAERGVPGSGPALGGVPGSELAQPREPQES